MDFVKALFLFNDNTSFGIELDMIDATLILGEWMAQERDEIEIEGYGIQIKEIVKIEFFK